MFFLYIKTEYDIKGSNLAKGIMHLYLICYSGLHRTYKGILYNL
jgi:hypothetical protein